MPSFDLFLTRQKINESTSGSYDLLKNPFGYTGDLNLNGVGNFKSGVNVDDYLGVGLESFFSGNINAYGTNSFYGLSQFASVENTGNFSQSGVLQQTGSFELTGDLRIGGNIYLNGASVSTGYNIESVNSSTGDFRATGDLYGEGLFVSGQPSSLYGSHIVGITGESNSSRTLVEIHKGSILVTGNGTDTGFFHGAHKSADGSIGLTKTIEIEYLDEVAILNRDTFVFKNGLLVSHATIEV